MGMPAKNMLKVGSGVVAPIAMRAVKVAAWALAVLWPIGLLLPINFKIALAVGVPYAALAGAAICGTRKGRAR